MTQDPSDALALSLRSRATRIAGASVHVDLMHDDGSFCLTYEDGIPCLTGREEDVKCSNWDLRIVGALATLLQWLSCEKPLVELWDRVQISGEIEYLMCASGLVEGVLNETWIARDRIGQDSQ